MEAAPKTGDAKPTTGIAGNAPPAKMKRKVSAEEDEHKRNSRLGKELIAYCIFLILFCVVTVVPIDDPNYEGLSYAMRDLMLETDHTSFNTNASFAGPKFAAVSSVSDYWKWLRGPFLHAIYMSDWYAGSPWSVGDQGLVAGNNLIVGTVNIRQKRVVRASCKIPVQFRAATTISDCVADYSPGVEDKEAFGPFYTDPQWAGAFTHSAAWPGFGGSIRSYDNGGFAHELPATSCTLPGPAGVKITAPCLKVADGHLRDLQMTGWIDYRTRAVATEAFVYNPSLNQFVMIQAVLEMPSTGGVHAHVNVKTSRLLRYTSTADLALLGLEIAMLLLIVFDVMEKVVHARRNGYWVLGGSAWDGYDAVFHALFYVMMVMRLNTESSFGRLNFDPTVRIYYDFANVMYWDEVANGMASVIAWMLWFRAFKYLHHLSWARQILETLYRAVVPLTGLCLAGLVLLLAFAHSGMLAFGTQIHDLRTFGVALISCYRFIFSGMQYDEFRAAGEFLGPLFYVAFKVWMVLIYVRFFVAVILDAYRDAMQEQRNRWQLSFPPLQALAQDIARWWGERNNRRLAKRRMRRGEEDTAGGGAAHETLGGETMPAVQGQLKNEMAGLSELDAKEMYEVIKDRVSTMQTHMDMRISNIEKIFVTTVAPLVETLDILVRQHTENAALATVRAVKRS